MTKYRFTQEIVDALFEGKKVWHRKDINHAWCLCDKNFTLLHTEPIGIFLSREWSLTPPKQKVKKLVEFWLNIYKHSSDGGFTNLYKTKEDAIAKVGSDVIDTIKLTGAYEVEE
jgi:hypothetical protein